MSDKTALTSEKVEYLFLLCMFDAGEDHRTYIPAEGVTQKIAFHPGRIEEHKAEIAALLDELPDAFKETGGGGMSFLQSCEDKHGNQWTSYHKRMEQLFLLGLAAGKVSCLAPRELWGALPGGMPYYRISKEFKSVEQQTA